MISELNLTVFVQESNMIEGIGETRRSDILSHSAFLKAPNLTVEVVNNLVYDIAGALLRTRPDMNVRVGQHVAPHGGPLIRERLQALLDVSNAVDPALIHQKFLTLHPFMDGNGRAARALWLRTMIQRGWAGRVVDLGFLHAYYYQTLALADLDVGKVVSRSPSA